MKKLLILTVATTLAFAGMAQQKQKGKGQDKQKSEHHNRTHDNDDRYDHDDNNNKQRKKGNTTVYQDGQNAKYSKNVPAQVRAAFNRDYPGAANVSWTKNNGYWIASFPNGIYRTTATYAANGQRINGATTKAYTRRRTTSPTQEGSIWDKILARQ